MIAALDIGGTKLACALLEGARVVERLHCPTPADRSPKSIVQAALTLARPLLGQCSKLGVASTGTVSDGRVTALNAQTLHGWHAFDLQNTLKEATGLPVALLNDADAAAYGEYVHGSGQGTNDFMFVTVSTGIGAGLVLGGRLHLTPHGLQAELGHTLGPDNQALEHTAGGAALDHWAQTHGWADSKSLVAQASAGNAAADAQLEQSAKLLACKLADVRMMTGISRVALGGGLGLAAGYLGRVRRQLDHLGLPWAALELLPARLGADAGLIGAAAWVKQTD